MTAAAVPHAVTRGQGRAAVVSAAWELIGRRGLHALRMRDVAAAAGVSVGSTTYHFADRDDLITAALAAHTEAIEQFCADAINSPEAAAQRDLGDGVYPRTLIRQFVAVTTSPRYAHVSTEMHAEAARSAHVAAFAERCTTARRRLLTEACTHSGYDPATVAWLGQRILAIADGMALRGHAAPHLASDVHATILAELEMA